jgi:hypothetical protein
MADLINLSEAKTGLGIPTGDTSQDDSLSQLLPMVSQAIRNETERDFGTPLVTETRTFEYDGSGFLDIDDASAITAVSLVALGYPSLVLDPALGAWRAMPQRRDDAPVYWYISIYGGVGISPEMGFKQNLDRFYAEGGFGYVPTLMEVTGTWGWPVVPQDVKLAAIWTLQSWSGSSGQEGLTSESIESYSRSWAGSNAFDGALGVPNRAKDLLATYQKIHA